MTIILQMTRSLGWKLLLLPPLQPLPRHSVIVFAVGCLIGSRLTTMTMTTEATKWREEVSARTPPRWKKPSAYAIFLRIVFIIHFPSAGGKRPKCREYFIVLGNVWKESGSTHFPFNLATTYLQLRTAMWRTEGVEVV